MAHRHPEDRIYTVMSGIFYIGLGDRFDGDKVQAFPPGSVIVRPGDTPHFHWAKSGEYVTQITAVGPLGLEYLNPVDDPRERSNAQAGARSAGTDSGDTRQEVCHEHSTVVVHCHQHAHGFQESKPDDRKE